jgi:protein-disulfide isomerase
VVCLLAVLAAGVQSDPLAPRSKGRSDAPIVVYEMADFQCPACRAFALQTFPAIEREYVETGKVRWVFVHFPLTSIHPNAVPAAQLASCAARQNRFWPLHDLLFAHQQAWSELADPTGYLLTLADSVRLDRSAVLHCANGEAVRREVESDAARAWRSGARQTPSFYIEGGILAGAAPIAVFRQVLDSIYRTKRPSGRG